MTAHPKGKVRPGQIQCVVSADEHDAIRYVPVVERAHGVFDESRLDVRSVALGVANVAEKAGKVLRLFVTISITVRHSDDVAPAP